MVATRRSTVPAAPGFLGRVVPGLRTDLILPFAIVVIAGCLRFIRLGSPAAMFTLDEGWYVPEARAFLDSGASYLPTPHPPLGKLFIRMGMSLFGDGAFGWRVGSAIAGTGGVLVMYLIGRRLWRHQWVAALAAILLAFEGLWFVQSRIAMLDIYAAFFSLCGIWLLLEDRARGGDGGVRWWRIASGVAFGLALSSKLTSASFFLGALALALAWDRHDTFGRRARAIVGSMIVVPIAVYTATNVPLLITPERIAIAPCQSTLDDGNMAVWLCYQKELIVWNADAPSRREDGTLINNYLSHAWSWPWAGRPVSHYESNPPTKSERGMEVSGIPNPVVWWAAFFIAIPSLVIWARRDWTARFILLFVALGYLPYLIGGLFGRLTYFYYATLLAPCLVLAVTHVISRMTRHSRRPSNLAIAYAILAVGSFAFFFPVLTGVPILSDGWTGYQARLWLTMDCSNLDVKHFCWW